MTTTKSGPTQMSGEILADAARRMLPVLAGRLLTAVADRAVEKVDGLADRLNERTNGASPARAEAPDEGDGSGGQGRAGVALAFLVEQARLFLAFVARLAAQALEMLRRATEQLRASRAPEGIDEAPALEEVTAPEDRDDLDDEYDEDLEDEYEDDLEDEYDDADTEERATVDA